MHYFGWMRRGKALTFKSWALTLGKSCTSCPKEWIFCREIIPNSKHFIQTVTTLIIDRLSSSAHVSATWLMSWEGMVIWQLMKPAPSSNLGGSNSSICIMPRLSLLDGYIKDSPSSIQPLTPFLSRLVKQQSSPPIFLHSSQRKGVLAKAATDPPVV